MRAGARLRSRSTGAERGESLDDGRRTPVLIRRLPPRAWALLAVALVLRLAAVAATFDAPLTLDAADFSRNGWSIAQGHGVPPSNRAPAGQASAYRPPAFPLFLGGVYASVGREAPGIARLAEAVLGTLAVGLIGLIATRIWGGRVGMLALGIAALAPPLVILSTALVSEALFVPLTLGAVLAALEARRSSRPLRWAFVTGALVGAAELTRTNALLLLPPLALALWTAQPRTGRMALMRVGVMVAAVVVAVIPWTVRNLLTFHAFVPVSTEVGYTLAGTYNQASRADQRWPAVWKEAEHGASPEYARILFYASTQRWNERRLGDRLLSAAIADIRHDPAYVLKVGVWNTIRMFHLGELDFAVANLRDTDIPRIPALLAIYGFYPLGILALAGIGTARVRQAPAWIWLLAICLGSTVFVTGFIRFRSPIDPFLVMLAALPIAAALERRDRRDVLLVPEAAHKPRLRRRARVPV
jgi:4-amino-4-deoxy-L-arabinose transferase-like glycosyltransferase